MKRFLLALALTGVLSSSALAGTIDTCGAPAPGQTQGGDSTDPGDMGSGGRADGDMGNGAPTALLIILDLLF